MRWSSSSEHREREDEYDRQASSVKGTSDQVRVVLEDPGLEVAEVVLDVKARDDPAEEDAGLALIVRDIARVLNELRHVDLGDVKFPDPRNKLE